MAEWTAKDLKITHTQAEYLGGDTSNETSSGATSYTTEDSLTRRGMLRLSRDTIIPHIIPSAKGIAALKLYNDKNRAAWDKWNKRAAA